MRDFGYQSITQQSKPALSAINQGEVLRDFGYQSITQQLKPALSAINQGKVLRNFCYQPRAGFESSHIV